MHSICAKCITSKLCSRSECSFECPQCEELCTFAGGVEFIRDNGYILAYLKTKVNEQEAKPQCQQHEREIILYCDSCQEYLCSLCSRTEHQLCNIFGLQEEKLSESLRLKFKYLKKTLENKRQMFLKGKHDNDQKAQTCIEQIKSDKEQKLKEVTMLFDEHIKAVSEQNMQVNSDIDNSVAEIDANIEKIEDFERNGDSATSMSMIVATKDIQQRTQALSRRSVVNSYEYVRKQRRDSKCPWAAETNGTTGSWKNRGGRRNCYPSKYNKKKMMCQWNKKTVHTQVIKVLTCG